MSHPLYLVDAFADGPFTGNPAAVVWLDGERDDRWLQQVAAEMNQAETAFVGRRGDGFSLRWFTPLAEVALCGHATLASAHVLWSEGFLPHTDIARFHTLSGVLTAERDDGDGVTLDFPSIASHPVDAPTDLASALGVLPRELFRGDFDLLCVVEDAEALRALAPDLAAVARWPYRGVIVTAAGDESGIDFVSRCFFPALGVPEDPVTGSAHCALAPYWGKHLGRDTLVGRQISRRGGVVACRVAANRIKLSGRAVTTVRGRLDVG